MIILRIVDTHIEIKDTIPDFCCSFGVTADMIRTNLDGWTLQLALQSRRVFLVDYVCIILLRSI